jgi:hypothetical protein
MKSSKKEHILQIPSREEGGYSKFLLESYRDGSKEESYFDIVCPHSPYPDSYHATDGNRHQIDEPMIP